jgi:hypothetical protein
MRVRAELWAQLDQLQAYREANRPHLARATAVVVGILLDKLLVLEQRDQPAGMLDPENAAARVVELVDAIEQRAASGG